MSLLKIGNEVYIIDFEAIDKLIGGEPEFKEDFQEESETVFYYQIEAKKEKLVQKQETIKKFKKGKEIDLTKYELVKTLIDILISNNDEVDDALGFERAIGNMPISFKLAFNTLKYYRILKKIDI